MKTRISETIEDSVLQPSKNVTKRLVSYQIFMKHVSMPPNSKNVDISGVFSRECFDEWVKNRKIPPKEPEESFRKALVAHVSGKDDRRPFPEEVEAKILQRLRASIPWPCFQNGSTAVKTIGERGIKKSTVGHHEAKKKNHYIPEPKHRKLSRNEFSARVLGISGTPTGFHPMAMNLNVGIRHFNYMNSQVNIPIGVNSYRSWNEAPSSFPSVGIDIQSGFLGFNQTNLEFKSMTPMKRPITVPSMFVNPNSSVFEIQEKKEDLVSIIIDLCWKPQKRTHASQLAKNLCNSNIPASVCFEFLSQNGSNVPIVSKEALMRMDTEKLALYNETDFFDVKLSEQKFDEKRLVGESCVTMSGQIINLNDFGRRLLDHNLLTSEKSFFLYIEDPLHRLFFLKDLLVSIHLKTEVWRRGLLTTTATNKPEPFLLRFNKLDNKNIEIYFQQEKVLQQTG